MTKEELIRRIISGEDIRIEDFNSLMPEERISLENKINEEILNGNSKYYKCIPYLNNFDNVELLTQRHKDKLSDENWYELVTEIYLRKPSNLLLEAIVDNAKTNKYALESIKKISSKKPNLFTLPSIIDKIEKQNKEQPPVLSNQQPVHMKPKRKSIIYFKLTSGLIIKLNIDELKAYRFDEERHEWQEDSVLFTEYEYGKLLGQEFDIVENYPYGEQYRHGRHL